MSRRVAILVDCDLDGTTVNENQATLVKFSWMGKDYELDTCDQCDPAEYSIGTLIDSARKSKNPALCCDSCDFCAKTPGGLELHKTRKHS